MAPSDSNQLKIRPPHQQVEEALATMLEGMAPGDQLPPEPALAQQLGVSRATLREVLLAFVERGVLVRRHGVGTFVASRIPILESGLEVLESLDSLARRKGLETRVAAPQIVEREATLEEAAGLELPPDGDRHVLAISRVIAVEGAPVAHLVDVVPTEYLERGELDGDFRGSVLDLLLERGSPMLSTSRTEIRAVAAGEHVAQRLQVPRGTALLKLVAQLYSYDERVVDYSVSHFVPGHFKFHVMRKVGRT
jgi:GntR family transcriptional regulator